MPTPLQPVLRALRVYPVKSMAGSTPDVAVVEPWGLAGDRRWTLIDDTGKVVTQRQQPRLALCRAVSGPDGGIILRVPGDEPLSVAVPVPAAGAGSWWGEVFGETVVVDIFGTKVEAVPAGRRADARMSAYLGAEVTLVHLDRPAERRPVDPRYARAGDTVSFADGYPLLVTTLSSLDALNSLVAQGDHPDEGPLPMDRFRPNLVIAGTAPWAEDGWRRVQVGEVVLRVAKGCGRCVVTTTDQDTAERGKEPLRTLGRHRVMDGKLIFGQLLVPESAGTLRVGDPLTVLD
jgi:uncharacterized protein YcbX